MKSVTTIRFREAFAQLPTPVQLAAKAAYKKWKENHTHPGLNFKLVNSSTPIYSVRISLNYRALGILEEDTLIWFWIGSHADYDKLLKTL